MDAAEKAKGSPWARSGSPEGETSAVGFSVSMKKIYRVELTV